MKFAIVGLYVACILFVHFRGKARLRFSRQIFDHSSVVSPINVFIYLFSKVPTHKAYLPVSEFKGLKLLTDNWQIIRDEALALENLEKIKAAKKNDDAGFNSFLEKVGSVFISSGMRLSILRQFNFAQKLWHCWRKCPKLKQPCLPSFHLEQG